MAEGMAMAEETGAPLIPSPTDAQSAMRLAAVEVHIHYIKDAVQRLEAAQTSVAANIHTMVSNALAERDKKIELMITALGTEMKLQLASQEKVSNVQATVTAEKFRMIMPIRDTVLRWGGIITFLVGLTFLASWLLNRLFPALPKP